MSEAIMEIEYPEQAKDGWSCENDQDAEWCMTQIRRAEEEKLRWKAHYKEALDSVISNCDETIFRMERFLRDYFEKVPHKHTKTEENYALPSGKLMIKAQGVDYEYDEPEVLKWLKEHNKGFIKVKESLDWAGLKETLSVVGETVADEEAEVIPCIKAVERPATFKVQLKKKEG